jgi:hypothetical protein
MTDQDSEVSPGRSAAEAQGSTSFSKNGSDRGGSAVATEYDAMAEGDGANFLADLAKAMQSTAATEQARNAEGTEQKRQSHIDAIRAREALEAEQLRELAKDDVKGIDAWSDGEIKRVKLERERRIAARREQLQVRLEEHRTVVGREVDAVESAVASYRAEIDEYFRRLEGETDPVAIARYAGNRPAFPDLDQIGPDDVQQISTYAAAAPPAVATDETPMDAPVATSDAPAADQDAPAADHDAPVNGSMIGVMEPDAQATAPVDPWTGAPVAEPEAQDEAVAESEPVAEAAPVAEAEAQPVAVAEAGPEAEAQPIAEAQPVGQAVGAPEHEAEPAADAVASAVATESSESDEGSQEPVGALAEARVVMPRASGAGSWLRWPNSSSDHTDSNQ